MTSPALMVLYSNDAVEVRYTDQSCLQVAPCGSTFVHHESPKEVIHPAHGMKTISQRSEFVTSDYRHKLINALDFRNRFAEKPFLCKDLIMPDQIVPLYANIKEAAWPKSVDDCEIDYLPDGSVRLLSADEYASLVLSPHRQDFTVCYLCQISTEAKKTKRNQHRKPNSKAKPPERREEKLDTTLDNNPDARHPQQGNRINASTTSQYSSHVDQAQGFERDSLEMDESLSKQTRNELNFSPISFASSMRSPHRSPENQQDSNNFHRYSTPTNHGPDQNKGDEIEIGGKKSAFKHYRQMQGQGSDGSFMEVIESQKTSKSSRCLDQQSQESNRMCLNKGIPESSSKEAHLITTEAVHKHNMSKKQIINLPPSDAETPNVSPTRGPAHSSFNSQPEQESNEETSTQCLYTWVTRHFSCDECPVAWRHPLNMARSMIDQREEHEKRILNGSEMKTKKDVTNHLYSKENYCICSLPAPLPLTCPAQHLHKLQINYIIDDDKSSLDNLTTFKQGRLKVLMVEGVIFRILRLSSTRVLEVYPGDGSVIVSQGVKGLYYKHIIPFGDRSEVEERSYSIKTLPPPTPEALYHVEKLVKRANRFHNQANQEDKILTKADVCCWKQQSLVIDALPTTLLEECTVPGYGRFTAFSSGHVRIVFNDRTSLDMWCDFSKRLECCIQHSEGIHGNQCRATTGEGAMPTALKVNAELREGFCKLLLPNGQYQVVDVKKPGLYRKYTDAAIEWGLWVNSLPSQRKEFYTKWQQQKSDEQMVQKELQKIKCFNYIADHTAPNGKGRVKEKSSDGSMEQMMGRVGLNKSQGPLIATSSALKTPHSQPPLNSRSELHVHFSPPSASSHPSMSHDHSHMSLQSHHGISQSGMLPSNLEMMQGFDSVREALLKTSKVIHDIDDILDKRKS